MRNFVRPILPVGAITAGFAVMISVAVAANYDGHGPGTSTIGNGGDYPSLYAACQAINSTPLAGGDWTFLILNDLVEPNNSSIAQSDLNGHTITLRPAPGVDAVVEFTAAISGFYPFTTAAHLTIGATEVFAPPSTRSVQYAPTHNIIIDGSNTPGGTTRNLTFTNTASAGARTLLGVMGECTYITFRNCNLVSNGTRERATNNYVVPASGIDFQHRVPANPSEEYEMASHCTVENCGISAQHSAASAGVSFNLTYNSTFAPSLSEKMTVRNCQISGTSVGVLAHGVRDFSVAANQIHLNGGSAGSFPVAGVYVWPNYTGDLHIARNSVNVENGEEAEIIYGLGLHARADHESPTGVAAIDNNALVLPNVSAGSSGIRFGIRSLRGSIIARHNSVEMLGNGVANQSSVGIYVGNLPGIESEVSDNTGDLVATNNIIRTSVPQGRAIGTRMAFDSLQTNYNSLYATNGAYVGSFHKAGAGYWPEATLSDWQTETGQDMDSISRDPYIAAGPNLGVWAGPSGSTGADLRFTSFPGTDYLVPFISGVEVDIDGSPRSTPQVIIGAHETDHAPAAVTDWAVY